MLLSVLAGAPFLRVAAAAGNGAVRLATDRPAGAAGIIVVATASARRDRRSWRRRGWRWLRVRGGWARRGRGRTRRLASHHVKRVDRVAVKVDEIGGQRLVVGAEGVGGEAGNLLVPHLRVLMPVVWGQRESFHLPVPGMVQRHSPARDGARWCGVVRG